MRYFIFSFLLPIFLLSAEESSPLADELLDHPTYNYWQEFIHMIITLGLILALVILVVWFLKKFMRNRLYQSSRQNQIQILEKRALSTKSALYLIEVSGKKILISESHSGIQCLSEHFEQSEVSRETSCEEESEAVDRVE